MSQITALMIDSREPAWVKDIPFGDLPKIVTLLDTADIQAVTDDGHTILIERKTPEDFLNTLREDRLFPQLARMTEIRNVQVVNGEPITYWPYLVITDLFGASHDGKIITDRGVTGWSFASVMGTILSIQEMGILVTFCNGQIDYQDCVLRIGRRSRDPFTKIASPRPAKVLGPKFDFLAGIRGIETEYAQKILEWSSDNLAHAITGLVDLSIRAPVPFSVRKNFRALLGLEENESFEVIAKEISANGQSNS